MEVEKKWREPDRPALFFEPVCSPFARNQLEVDTPYPERVGVGITIAHDPLHRSGRAGFPHPALALGDDAHAAQRIGMTDRRQRQPASAETPHAIPEDVAVLTPPRQRAMPIPADSEPKNRQLMGFIDRFIDRSPFSPFANLASPAKSTSAINLDTLFDKDLAAY
jgi:hypothetical protein